MLFRIFHKQMGTGGTAREMLEQVPPQFKEYSRFPQHRLPTPRMITMPLQRAAEQRVSGRNFGPGALRLADLADIIALGAGINHSRGEKEPRMYRPSGGALYPLECYVVPFRVETLPQSALHYEVRRHSLAELITCEPVASFRAIWKDAVPDMDPAAVLVITSVWGRSYAKYGEFAYRLALMEAGHMAQNMLLAAAALSIQACPAAGFRQTELSHALDINDQVEDPLYLIFLGA